MGGNFPGGEIHGHRPQTSGFALQYSGILQLAGEWLFFFQTISSATLCRATLQPAAGYGAYLDSVVFRRCYVGDAQWGGNASLFYFQNVFIHAVLKLQMSNGPRGW